MAPDPVDRPSIEQAKSNWEAVVTSLVPEAESLDEVPAEQAEAA